MRQLQASTSLGKSRKRYRRKKTARKLAITPTQARSQAKARQSPKGTARTKNSALKPTKRAFSERQRTTIRDNSQASAKEIKRRR